MTEAYVVSAFALVKWMGNVESAVLTQMAQQCRVAQVQKGTVFVHRGQSLRELCVIGEGKVASSRTNANGKRLVVTTYERGQAFGLNPVLDGEPAVYDTEATVACTLIWIPRQALIEAMQVSQKMMMGVVLEICARSRDLLAIINDRSLAPGAVRVGRLLLILARRNAPSDKCDVAPLSVAITQGELAEMLGISRQQLNPEIRKLQRRNFVQTHYKAIELVDAPGLERFIAEGN